MDSWSGYQKQGLWILMLGTLLGGSVLYKMESSRAKPVQPQVEYIGETSKSEPRGRAPSSLPAAPHPSSVTSRQ